MAEIRSKKRKVAIIHESSSSGEEITPSKPSVDELDQSTCQSTPRSSERLQKKRCRVFRKPSRDDVWEKITPSKSPGKYEQLRPKRLVNNYTKENSSYNYDPNETSGDESMNDFLDDSISEQSSSDSDDARARCKEKHKVRIKGRRRRLQDKSMLEESSSSDSDNEVVAVTNNLDNNRKENNEDILSGDSAICVESGKREIDKVIESDNNEDSDDETEVVTKKKRHNRSIIESDENDISDSDSKKGRADVRETTQGNKREYDNVDPDDSDENIVMTRKHNRSIIDSDVEDCGEDKHDGNVELQVPCSSGSGGHAEGSSDLITDIVRKEKTDIDLECNGQSHSTNKIEEKFTSTQKNNNKTTNSVLVNDTTVVDDPDNSTSSSESVSDSSEVSDDSDTSDNDETDDEDVGNSSRVRVQLLKKKNDREKLFDKFRKERQRKLSKEH